jgi:hypothetical protein
VRRGSQPRPTRAPRLVIGSWAASVVAGATLLALPALASNPTGLSPQTVDRFLARAAGPGAHEIRVNGLYGSGHDGAWQFVAHLTWRTTRGQLVGGTTALPQRAGAPPFNSAFGSLRLAEEEDRGWSLSDFRAAARDLRQQSASVQMMSLEIPSGSAGQLTVCRAIAGSRAACVVRERTGHTATFADDLVDQPELDALSVQRRAAPVTGLSGQSDRTGTGLVDPP